MATHLALIAGAALVAASGLIHLHLWADGYQHIPTIGPLFFIQAITGLVLAGFLVAYPRVITAAVGAGYLLVTIAALMVSVSRGFLGFMDPLNAPWAVTSLALESAGALALLVGGSLLLLTPSITGLITGRATEERTTTMSGRAVASSHSCATR